jgi:hypothetical protein
MVNKEMASYRLAKKMTRPKAPKDTRLHGLSYKDMNHHMAILVHSAH